MKKPFFSFIALLTFVILAVSFNANVTEAAENTKEEDFELPRYFDANDKEIFPYTKEEYIERYKQAESFKKASSQLEIFSVERPRYYDTYGYAGFRNYVWINGGELYRNPIYVNLERITRTDKMALYVYDSNGAYQGKFIFPKYGNIWEVAPCDHLTRSVHYKFKLVSESGEFAEVKHGNIAYDG